MKIVIYFFAGFGGSYFLENDFWLLAIAVLGIAGILLRLVGAVGASLSWGKVDPASSAPAKKRNVPRVTSEWHYRPREASRRLAAANSASAESSDVLSPSPLVINNNNVSWNKDSYEYPSHTLVNH
jgi:hypothetical protein